MDLRRSILVAVPAKDDVERAGLQKRLGSCDIREHVQWLVEGSLLEPQQIIK